MKISLKAIVLAGILAVAPALAQPSSQTSAAPQLNPPDMPNTVTVSPEDAAKRALAARYFATQDENANFERLVAMLAGSFLRSPDITPKQRADFMDYARSHLDREAVKNSMIGALMDTYTMTELKALADFYSSPIGQQVSAKTPTLAANWNASITPIAIGFISNYAAQCTDKSTCIDMAKMVKK